MTPVIVAAACLCGLVLALVAASLLAVLRTRAMVDAVRREAREADGRQSSIVETLDARLNALAERVEDARAFPHAPTVAPDRGGINLSRRSQALRLHRRGQTAAQIAAELGIPVQEVALLMKVHEIVMSTV